MNQPKELPTQITHVMTSAETPLPESSSPRISKLVPASLVASALGVLITATIYFIGVQFKVAYFDQFRIDADRFPRDKAQTMLYGINAIAAFCQSVFKYINREWSVLLVTFLFLLAISSFWALLNHAQTKVKLWKQQQEALPTSQRGMKLASIVASISALPFLSVYSMFGLPLIISVVIALPATVGSYAGKKAAQRSQQVFLACPDHLPSPYSFVQVRDGNTIKAQGFLIAASTERVALFDGGIATDYPIKDNEVTYMQGVPRQQDLKSVEHPTDANKVKVCGKPVS